MRHLTSLLDVTAEEIGEILDLASLWKARCCEGERPDRLGGRVLTQVFEKPSLRTRASFDAAMAHLGGSSQFFSAADAGLGGRTLPRAEGPGLSSRAHKPQLTSNSIFRPVPVVA